TRAGINAARIGQRAVQATRGEIIKSVRLSQEHIVLLITLLLFAVFTLALDNFLSSANMLTLLRSVSVLGILGLGMLIVVLGRGIDLSMVAIMAISVAWSMQLA